MKPIIIKTQDGINVNTTVKELEEIINTIYEQGVEDGKTQERALKNTQFITYRDSSSIICDTVSADVSRKQRPNVEYV